MKKQTLETFIKKYSLNGVIDSVKWTVAKDKKILNTKSITEEKNVLLDVTQKNFEAIEEEFFSGAGEEIIGTDSIFCWLN